MIGRLLQILRILGNPVPLAIAEESRVTWAEMVDSSSFRLSASEVPPGTPLSESSALLFASDVHDWESINAQALRGSVPVLVMGGTEIDPGVHTPLEDVARISVLREEDLRSQLEALIQIGSDQARRKQIRSRFLRRERMLESNAVFFPSRVGTAPQSLRFLPRDLSTSFHKYDDVTALMEGSAKSIRNGGSRMFLARGMPDRDSRFSFPILAVALLWRVCRLGRINRWVYSRSKIDSCWRLPRPIS